MRENPNSYLKLAEKQGLSKITMDEISEEVKAIRQADQLQKESEMVQEESVKVLAEFEQLQHEDETIFNF